MLLSTDYQADVALPPTFITFDNILGRDFFYPNNHTHFPNTHIPHLLDTLVQIIFEITSFMLLYILIRHEGKFAST